MSHPIYCFGEILWDCLPSGMFLGGAPFNVACHLTQLGADAKMISCVGPDFRGDEALRRAKEIGVDMTHVSRHPELPTGTVTVHLNNQGNAAYEFPTPVAWDEILLSDSLKQELTSASALVFGTLALRLHENRDRMRELLEINGPMKCLDVNLRTPYDDIERALKFASRADLLKLNEEELALMTDTPVGKDEAGLAQQCERLNVFTHLTQICVTRGGEGALFWKDGEIFLASTPPVEVVDTVGAGDAFMAALVNGMVSGLPIPEVLSVACEHGAKVAGQSGAI